VREIGREREREKRTLSHPLSSAPVTARAPAPPLNARVKGMQGRLAGAPANAARPMRECGRVGSDCRRRRRQGLVTPAHEEEEARRRRRGGGGAGAFPPAAAAAAAAATTSSSSRSSRRRRPGVVAARASWPDDAPAREDDAAPAYLSAREPDRTSSAAAAAAAASQGPPPMVRVRFHVHYRVHSRQMLCIGGSQIPFGWSFLSIAKVPMTWNEGDVWTCEVRNENRREERGGRAGERGRRRRARFFSSLASASLFSRLSFFAHDPPTTILAHTLLSFPKHSFPPPSPTTGRPPRRRRRPWRSHRRHLFCSPPPARVQVRRARRAGLDRPPRRRFRGTRPPCCHLPHDGCRRRPRLSSAARLKVDRPQDGHRRLAARPQPRPGNADDSRTRRARSWSRC
jgi:hypothetical protein